MAGERKRRGRGEGSVEQLPDGRWRAILSLGVEWVPDPDDPGCKIEKRKRRKFYGKTKKEALEKLREAQQQAATGQLPDAGKMTFGQWAERWLELKRPSVEYATWSRYKQVVTKHLSPLLGGLMLSGIGAAHVEGMYARMTANGVSASEQRRAGSYLSTIMRHAVKRKLIHHNPVPDVPKPKKRRADFTAWTADQARTFLKACGGLRLEAFFVLALDTGMRPGELYALHWTQVNLDAGTVSVVQALECVDGELQLKDVKTKKGKRTLVVSRRTVEALRQHRERMVAEKRDVASGPVFVDTAGGLLRQTNVYHRTFIPTIRKAGVPKIRPYDLRHTCATLLLIAGVNIKIVSERLGHSAIQMTLDHYAKVLPGMQAIAADAFDRIMESDSKIVPQ